MFGWLLIGASVLAMYRIADAENKSGLLWGGLTFALCLACALLIPLPLINIGIGFALSFGALFVYKVVKND